MPPWLRGSPHHLGTTFQPAVDAQNKGEISHCGKPSRFGRCIYRSITGPTTTCRASSLELNSSEASSLGSGLPGWAQPPYAELQPLSEHGSLLPLPSPSQHVEGTQLSAGTEEGLCSHPSGAAASEGMFLKTGGGRGAGGAPRQTVTPGRLRARGAEWAGARAKARSCLTREQTRLPHSTEGHCEVLGAWEGLTCERGGVSEASKVSLCPGVPTMIRNFSRVRTGASPSRASDRGLSVTQ